MNGHSEGYKGHRAVIEGLVFQSGRTASDTTTGAFGILSLRVDGVVARGNRFEGGFNSSVDPRASTGTVERHHLSGRGSSCDICLAGPGDYAVRNNRLVGGGLGGVLILPAGIAPVAADVEQYVLLGTSLITATIVNNKVRDHLRRPVGYVLRVSTIGLGAPNVAGTSRGTFTGNDLVSNTFGTLVEAGFVREGPRRGDVQLTASGNTISQSCQSDLLVSLSSSQVGLGIATGLPLLNSAYAPALGSDLS